MIAGRRPAIIVPPELGRPDGSTLDAEGMLWIALFDGGAVTRWNPETGELLQTIRLPARRVTSCAFGGADLGTLYVTTSQFELPEAQRAEQPLAGCLFALRPGVRGRPAFAFAG